MLRKIRKFFAPSTAKALKGFTKATSQLERVAAAEQAEADRHDRRMIRARDNRNAAIDRAAEAERLATKFKEFLA